MVIHEFLVLICAKIVSSYRYQGRVSGLPIFGAHYEAAQVKTGNLFHDNPQGISVLRSKISLCLIQRYVN